MKRKRLLEILSKVDKTVTSDFTDNDLIEYVACLEKVDSEEIVERRWWSFWEDVYEVEPGVYLKYYHARATGDETPRELGYEGETLENIWEVQRKEVKSYIYIRKD